MVLVVIVENENVESLYDHKYAKIKRKEAWVTLRELSRKSQLVECYVFVDVGSREEKGGSLEKAIFNLISAAYIILQAN